MNEKRRKVQGPNLCRKKCVSMMEKNYKRIHKIHTNEADEIMMCLMET
jgi:hypothetical protein